MMALLIFLSAVIFRISNLDLIEFKADEAINLLLAARPAFGYNFTYGGTVSSIGVLNPPLFNYILAPITFLTVDPKMIVLFIGLVNAIAITILFLIVKRYYGITTGLIFGFLFSLSPWAILYSRKIWMQDLIIPFFVPIFYSVHKLVLEKKSIYWLPYSIFSLLIIQLHQINVIFVVILTLFLLLQKVKLNLKYIWIGALIGILPLIPYFLYEFNNSCPDCHSLIIAREKLTTNRYFEVFLRPLQILSQGNFRFVLGDDTLTLAQKFPVVEFGRKIFYLEYLLLPFGLFIFIKKYKNLKFFSFIVILLPVIYLLLKIEPFMHYFIIATPLLFLFLAVAFDYLFSTNNFVLKTTSRVLLIFILVISVAFNFAFLKLLKERGALKGDYGTVYYQTEKEKMSELTELKRNKNFDEIYLSNFIPLGYVYGYQPLGKMLYSNIDYSEVLSLENDLKQNSKDPRVKQKIVSFYTKDKPTLQSLDLLREKSSKIPQYEALYRLVLGDYLSKNFKKEYIWYEKGYRFFYPEHWEIEKRDEKLTIFADGYYVFINESGSVEATSNTKPVEELKKSIRPL